MSKGQYLRNSFVYWVGRMFSRTITFFLLPIYTSLIKPAEWGILNILTVTGDLLALLALCQIPSAMYRFWIQMKSDDEKKKLSGLSIVVPFLISSLIFLPCYIWAEFFASLLGISGYADYFRIVLATQQIAILMNIIQADLRLWDKAKSFIAYELSFNFGSALLSIIFVVFLKIGIIGILLAQLIVYCIIISLLLPGFLKKYKPNIEFQLLKKMLIFSLPLVPAAIAMGTNNNIARYFLQFYHGANDVGLYSLGYKFGFLVNLIITGPFFLIWEPKSYEVAKRKDAPEQYGKIFTYLFVLLFFVATALTGAAKDIILVMAEKSYYDAWVVIPFISFAYVAFSLDSISKIGLLLQNKTKTIMSIVLLSSGINILLNFLLIPKYSITGAAVATLVTFFSLFTIDAIISNKFLKICFEWRKIWVTIISSVFIVLTCFMVNFENMYLRISIKILVICSFPLLLFILRFFSIEEITIVKGFLSKLGNKIAWNRMA